MKKKPFVSKNVSQSQRTLIQGWRLQEDRPPGRQKGEGVFNPDPEVNGREGSRGKIRIPLWTEIRVEREKSLSIGPEGLPRCGALPHLSKIRHGGTTA
ncbi:MAG: hypothetical protein LAO21_15685 [Acidobacteriia bacterium]|nr:hypothetical protein [Terriglobia bacterium]